MLKRTHEAFSGTFWQGGCLCLNMASLAVSSKPLVNLGAIITGTLVTIPFSAGKNSPDCDQLIWPGPPRKGYYWKGHRGITHRVWFAFVVITMPFIAIAVWIAAFLPAMILPLLFALPAGWWSHLMGDMIYGRILICGRPYGLGWTTGGLTETGKRKNGGKRYIIDPAAKFFMFTTAVLAVLNTFLFFGSVQ
jgi:hypothetical protein